MKTHIRSKIPSQTGSKISKIPPQAGPPQAGLPQAGSKTETQQKSRKMLSRRVLELGFSGIRRSFDLAQTLSGVISLGLGEPDFDTPPHIKEAAKNALDEGFTHYTPNAGFLELREAIAEKLLRENRIEAAPAHEIVVTVGGAEALFLSIMALVNPGDEVILGDPTFLNYDPCIRSVGGIPVAVPLREENQFQFLPEEIEKRITERTRGMIINSPQNPTGGVLSRQDLEAIAALARKHDLFVITDEVYEKLIYNGDQHYSIASFPGMKERTISVFSFSKTYAMCGWRIGYAAGPEHAMEQILKLQQFIGIHAPSFSQKAALAALTGPQDCVQEMVREYDARRKFLVHSLNEIPGFSCTVPKGAFYAFPNIKATGRSSQWMADYLLQEARVAVVAGSALGEYGEGYLRFTYTAPISTLQQAVKHLAEAMGKLTKASLDSDQSA